MSARSDHITEALASAVPWEWTRVDDLIEPLYGLVPPGKALRVYQRGYEASQRRQRNNSGEYPNKAIKRPMLTESAKIRSGAKNILNGRIWAMVKTGTVEMRTDDDKVRWVRRKDRRKAVSPTAVPEPTVVYDHRQRVIPGSGERIEPRSFPKPPDDDDAIRVHPRPAARNDQAFELEEGVEGLADYRLAIDVEKNELILRVSWLDLGSEFTVYEKIPLRPLLRQWAEGVIDRRTEPVQPIIKRTSHG